MLITESLFTLKNNIPPRPFCLIPFPLQSGKFREKETTASGIVYSILCGKTESQSLAKKSHGHFKYGGHMLGRI